MLLHMLGFITKVVIQVEKAVRDAKVYHPKADLSGIGSSLQVLKREIEKFKQSEEYKKEWKETYDYGTVEKLKKDFYGGQKDGGKQSEQED